MAEWNGFVQDRAQKDFAEVVHKERECALLLLFGSFFLSPALPKSCFLSQPCFLSPSHSSKVSFSVALEGCRFHDVRCKDASFNRNIYVC